MAGCKNNDLKVFAQRAENLLGIGAHVDCSFYYFASACFDGQSYIAEGSRRIVAVH